jgi:hypothetical protein
MSASEDRRLVDRCAGRRHLGGAAARTLLRRRHDEDLHVGRGADHGPDVAAVEHGAGRRCGEILLEREHHRAHLRERRDDRGGLADRVTFQRRLVEARRIERLRGAERPLAVIERMARIHQGLGDRAIDQPGVEMTQAVMGGKPLAERAFPRRSRSVDGDDHARL